MSPTPDAIGPLAAATVADVLRGATRSVRAFPDGAAVVTDSIEHRFGEKCWYNPYTGCIEWMGWLNRDGYGGLVVDGVRWLAHRLAYTLAHGQFPAGLESDHLCRNRSCVNPEHIEPVTHRENTLRSSLPRMIAHRENRCVRGHALTAENTQVIHSKRRGRLTRCATCLRAIHRAWFARHRTRLLALQRERWHARRRAI